MNLMPLRLLYLIIKQLRALNKNLVKPPWQGITELSKVQIITTFQQCKCHKLLASFAILSPFELQNISLKSPLTFSHTFHIAERLHASI
jgi:hypothetical protein